MSEVRITRKGGLAGFGGQGSHLVSRGVVETEDLSPEDAQTIETLFSHRLKMSAGTTRDGFIYELSRTVDGHDQTIEAPESAVPRSLIAAVKDELA